MLRLSSDTSSEFYERFPEATDTLAPFRTTLPAVSPPTSTTPDAEIQRKNTDDTTKMDELSMENGLDPVTQDDISNTSQLQEKELLSPCLPVMESDNYGSYSDVDSDASTLSGNTVLIRRTSTQEKAKKAFSPPNLEKRDPIPALDKELELASPSVSKPKTFLLPVIEDEVSTQPITKVETQIKTVPEEVPTQPITKIQTKEAEDEAPPQPIAVNTTQILVVEELPPESNTKVKESDKTEDAVPFPSMNCPKLKQKTSVALHRLPQSALDTLKQKRGGGCIKAKQLEDLDKAMTR